MALDAASVAAVEGARRASGDVLPLADGYTFAALPATVERLLLGGAGQPRLPRAAGYTSGALPAPVERLLLGGAGQPGLPRAALGDAPDRAERVVLVPLDAFGWRFFARHADRHPLLRRFLADGTVAKLTSQF